MRKGEIIASLLHCSIALLVSLTIPYSVNAVTVSILNPPLTVTSDPFTLTASISGALAGTNYLRIDLFKDGTIDYFGETYNGSGWYNGSNYEQYFPVTIVSGNPWTGDIQGRINSSVENGNYKLKIRRYTASGSQSSSDPVDININLPTPTPTLEPTLTPTPILTPTPTITPTIDPTSTPQPTPSPTNTPISYNNIYLSEIMVYPDTGDNEWIEIYNANDYPASLINWYIDDLENMGATPRIFSIEIAAKNYAVFNLSSSIFNNDGDNVRLLDFNKILKDSFEYNKSTKGKSLARVSFDTDSFCEQEPSKSLPNSGCIVEPAPTANPTSTPKPTNTPTPTKTPTPIKINDKNGSSKQQTYSSYSVLSNNETYDDEEQINQENEPNELINNGDSMILGSAVKNSSYQSTPLLKSLSFISFSFSGLTIASLLFKIIKNMY